jgi:photosystem II cytochrome c550
MSKFLLALLAALTIAFQAFTGPAIAADSDAHVLPVDGTTTYTISERELAKGKQLFNSACANCHAGGATYTNPNVGLDLESLSLATPRRDNLVGMIDYLKNPTTFDGEEEIYELHPSLRSTDIFPMMRGLTDEDLKLISGYVLYNAQLKGIAWGGGKIYY